MSWAWLAPLALGAVAAGLFARVAHALAREGQRVALSRLRLAEVRDEARRSRHTPG
ncbi:MAG: hypothetical protein M0005_06320 [Actinomycetota bacterium]|nr:hypothetical protein [Actinomycetota bacterium]